MRSRTPRSSRTTRRRSLTLGGALIAVGALALPAAAVAADTTIGVEDLAGWSATAFDGTTVSPSTPRAAGRGHTGSSSVEVLLDTAVRGTDSWEMAARSLGGVDLDSASFWIDAENLHTIGVQLVDATGQTHQTFLPVPDVDGWQEITLASPTDDPSHGAWGGAADGEWHGPAQQIGFVVNSWARPDTTSTTARALIDDITISAADVTPGFALSAGAFGNLFTVGDAVTLPYETTADTVAWRTTAADGRVVASGQEPADGALDLGTLGRGWYGLTVDALADGTRIGGAQTTIAVLADTDVAETADGRFGAVTHYGQHRDFASMPALAVGGVAQFRDEPYWSDVEKTPGVYDWSVARAEFLDQARSSGVRPLLLAGYGNPLYDGGNGPVSAEAVAAYSAYAAEMATEFGDMASGIEIWNEWDLGLGGNTNVAPEHYVNLLKSASPAVKAVDPDLPVIGPAVAILNTDWLEDTFRLGALDYLDGIVLHPYSYPVGAEALDETLTRIDALVREYNDGQSIPLWVTEHGWPTGTNARAVDEQTQAANIAKSAVITALHDVERYYVYDLVNDGVDAAETEENFGLLHAANDPLGAYTPKPAFVSYSTAADVLAGAHSATRDTSIADLWNIGFETPGGPVRALWSTSPRAVTVTLQGDVTVTDMYGSSRVVQAGAGSELVIDLRQGPVYLQGAVTGVTASATALTLDPAYLGQPIAAHWSIDNAASSTEGAYRLVFPDGQEVAQTVAAGQVGAVDFALPAATALGQHVVVGELYRGSTLLGSLTATTTVSEPVTLTGAQTIAADGGSVLRLTLGNASDESVTVDRLTSVLGGSTATQAEQEEVAAHAALVVDIALDGITARTTWSASALVGGRELAASGAVAPLAVDEALGAAHRTITVDGVLDDLDDLTPVVLEGQTWGLLAAFAASTDQSARFWYTWDEDNLYVSVEVLDDVHDQPAAGSNIWQGDSVQFTVAAGAPGAATTWHELGMALTPAGPQLYRWLAAGDAAGTVAGSQVAVVRDDAAQTTVYEAAVPWVRLTGVAPSSALLSSALIVNEADGAGRDGYLSWGGGIAGEKDSAEFLPVRLLAADVDPGTAGPGSGNGNGSGNGSGSGTGTGGAVSGAATGAATGDPLASTGAALPIVLVVLGLALAAGGCLLVVRRRRQTAASVDPIA